jgi:hypothetical protein
MRRLPRKLRARNICRALFGHNNACRYQEWNVVPVYLLDSMKNGAPGQLVFCMIGEEPVEARAPPDAD